MADGTWRSIAAQCPFFVRDGRKTITCEGLTEGEEIRRRMPDEARCTDVFREACAKRYRLCPVYRLINKVKYGIEDD